MNKIENYLGIANHDIQMVNDSEELKSYVASILCEIDELQQKNKQLQERMKYLERSNNRREDTIFEQSQKISDLEDKLSKIETLIINHNCDTGDIYYKYNSKFLKSELKQRILEIVYEEESDSNVKD